MKVMVIVDMQNDFVDGALGTKEAQRIVPNIVDKIAKCDENTLVLFTKDTHQDNYLDTQEGKMLPIPHCIENTEGWCINKEIRNAWRNNDSLLTVNSECGMHVTECAIKKPTFGSLDLVELLKKYNYKIESIEIFGVCTDICVISNALLLKANFTEIPITVDASCCAGVTPEKHNHALDVMESCQINVTNKK